MFRKKDRNQIIGLNFYGVSFIIIFVIASLMFYANNFQREKIVKEYCGEFGIYGNKLTLYNDNYFSYSYWGCSQTSGYVKGKWKTEDKILKLFPKTEGETLEQEFLISENKLIALNSDSIEFIVCEVY